MQNQLKVMARIAVMALLLNGCAVNDPYQRTKVGAGVGAVTGAVLGRGIDDDVGTYVGAAVGALAGGAVGNYMDRQQRAFEQTLAAERQRNDLEIQRLRDGSLRLGIPSEVSFDFDSAAIKPGFVSTLDKVADVLQQYDRTIVHIIGHTDSVGSDEYNMQLSQRRANSVADFLARQGVLDQRLRTEGRGERQPRAENASAAGRQLNRRVEIYINPLVEGQEQQAYRSPTGGYGSSPSNYPSHYPQRAYPQGSPSQGGYQDYPPRSESPPRPASPNYSY